MTDLRVELRAVAPADLEIFFIQQQDPSACEMAAFPPRSRPAFDVHWARVLADPSAITRTVLADGVVAGNAACFGPTDQREVAYWIGREFWGQGVATAALGALLAELSERPLHAIVAQHNAASLRVLEKCGFSRRGEQLAEDGILEIELELER